MARTKNKISTPERTNINGASLYVVRVNNFAITVNNNPFGNCQNWDIKNFNYVVNHNKDDVSVIGNLILKIKEKCGISKPYLIVDINRTVYERIKKHLPFVKKTPYNNANGSLMNLCIIDTTKIKTMMDKAQEGVK